VSVQLDLFPASGPCFVDAWRAIGELVRERGTGISGASICVASVAAPVVQCGRYVWALLEVDERGRPAWAHVRVHFADAASAERLDVSRVERVTCGVARDRGWAAYLHECGVSQWLHSLTEPGFEERMAA
jgi:hypothetical protein